MVPIVSLLLHRRHTSSSMQRALMGVDYMPYGSNCIIRFGEWCLEFLVHNFTCSHIPGQRGGSNFSDLDVFADRTVIYKFEICEEEQY